MLNKLITFIKLEIIHIEKRYSDKKLLPQLRSQVHVLEKRIGEGETNFLKVISARRLYFEAKNRDLLSLDEIDWCNHVLFGKSRHQKISDKDNNEMSSDLSTIIENRRSVRFWQESDISEEVFKELVEAAKWAPSSCNKQPWRFIVTSDKEKIKLLYTVKGQKFIKDAPYCILVIIDKNSYGNEDDFRYFSGLDAGAAIQNLLLKAEELGLGACWVNWTPTSVSNNQNQKVKETFKIPSDFDVISIIPIGKPKEKPSAPSRKDTEKILYFKNFNPAKERK